MGRDETGTHLLPKRDGRRTSNGTAGHGLLSYPKTPDSGARIANKDAGTEGLQNSYEALVVAIPLMAVVLTVIPWIALQVNAS